MLASLARRENRPIAESRLAKISRATCSIEGDAAKLFPDLWSADAADFIAALNREFAQPRQHILTHRKERSAHRLNGGSFEFLASTVAIRNNPDWRVRAAPKDLTDRRVEIASPADNRKIVINALNAHAQVWVADLEDAMSPTWHNAMASQRHLKEAVAGNIAFVDPNGKEYKLGEHGTAIVVRPRGWHLLERHVLVDGHAASASLVDFGLYFFHCARRQLERGSGPYFYLPKLENHVDAKLWNDVFEFAQDWIGIPHGSVRATALIEHIGAAFEMDEILHALGPHAAGLTAGRWDYLFSIAKEFRNQPQFVFPDRKELTMDLPFMRAYTDLLVRTCHRRGTHAIGGVATQIPDRHDPEAQRHALEGVRRDKEREVDEGFDGTWVVHPDLVAICHVAFDRAVTAVTVRHPQVETSAADLVCAERIDGHITENGLRSNVALSIRYLEAWLRGHGSVRLFGLMEGAATVEIARSQIWQWLRHGARLQDGRKVTRALLNGIVSEEIDRYVADSVDALTSDSIGQAKALFEEVAMGEIFPEFLTLPGCARLDLPGMRDAIAIGRGPALPANPARARTNTLALTCSSGMFTHLQLKPRVAFSFGFMGWSAWLIEHAVSHAALIRDHATGFVPIGLEISYLQPSTFFDCESLTVTTQVRTWNPKRFHSLQDVDVMLANEHGVAVVHVRMQEVCVRIESMQTLAALPGRVPVDLAARLLDDPDDIDEPPVLLNRGMARVPADATLIAQHRHEFVVHRHACEVSDQWYSEHVCDFIGDSREAMVLQLVDKHPELIVGLSRQIGHLRMGLRRPFMLFDRGRVLTRAFRVGPHIHFVHQLLTSADIDAGDAVEVFESP